MLSLHIFNISSGENLLKNQLDSSCVIMSLILITTLFYKAVILQCEIWCWSLLGLKGLRIPTGKRQTSWLLYKHIAGFEFRTSKNKSSHLAAGAWLTWTWDLQVIQLQPSNCWATMPLQTHTIMNLLNICYKKLRKDIHLNSLSQLGSTLM